MTHAVTTALRLAEAGWCADLPNTELPSVPLGVRLHAVGHYDGPQLRRQLSRGVYSGGAHSGSGRLPHHSTAAAGLCHGHPDSSAGTHEKGHRKIQRFRLWVGRVQRHFIVRLLRLSKPPTFRMMRQSLQINTVNYKYKSDFINNFLNNTTKRWPRIVKLILKKMTFHFRIVRSSRSVYQYET